MKSKKLTNILLSIFILCLYLSIYSGLGNLAGLLPFAKNHLYLVQVLVYIIMTVFLIITLACLKKLHILKFEPKKFGKGLLVGGYVVFFIIVGYIEEFNAGIDSGNSFLPISQIILFSISVIVGTGFTEEVLCRGIIQNLMYDAFGHNTKKGIVISIVITSILFGSAHFINYFNTNAGFEGVLTQVIVASLIGLYFGAIYARCHSIWTVAFLHGMFDFVQMIGEGFWGIGDVSQTIDSYKLTQIIAPIILYGFLFLFLLRKSKIKECFIEEKKETT